MHKNADKDTVSIHFVEAAVARLSPAARVRVLLRAGIAPELLRSADARVTSEAFAALWKPWRRNWTTNSSAWTAAA